MLIAQVVLGFVVLLFGRKLFWLFIAIAGFLFGMEVASTALSEHSPWLQLLAAIGLGALGAIVAVVAQRIGFALAGFYALGYFSIAVAERFFPGSSASLWFVGGGCLGAIVAALLMDPAIIVLASVFGAAAISTGLPVSPVITLVGFAVLAVAGMAFQFRMLDRAS